MSLRAVRRSLAFVAVQALLWGWANSVVAGGRPFGIDDMLRVAMVDDVRLSADGKRVAFTVTRIVRGGAGAEMLSRVFLADTGKGVSRPVSADKESCEKPRLSPDGSKLAYLVQGDGVADIMLLQLATGQSRRLTRGQADVLDMAFSPDGKTLAVTVATAGSGDGRTDGADVEILDANGAMASLFLMPFGPQASPIPLVTDRDVGSFTFSPDGTRIVFETSDPKTPPRGRRGVSAPGWASPLDAANADIAVVNVHTGVVATLAATDASENAPFFSPDGKWVAYVSTAAPGFYYNAARVMIVPATGGESRALAETPNARPELLGWSAGGDLLYVREASGTGTAILALPADGGLPREISTSNPHVVAAASLAPSGDTFGLVLTDSDMPAEVFVTPTDRFSPRPVSGINKEFTAFRTAKTEVVHWQAPDGTAIEGLYTHPLETGQGPPPLLVEIHGGPAIAADRQYLGALNYYPLAVFAERGYAVFRPNIRGSDGYGTAFRRGNLGDWGGVDFADLESGVDALIARGMADPARLGIMGWSYGGYLAAWAIGHTQRYKAASIGAGITNLVSQCGSMDLPDFIPLYFGGEAYERFETLFERSPLKYAASIKTPTLFQHGVSDERVPFTQSLELYTALSRLGVLTRLAVYPRSGHDVTEPELLRDLMSRNLEWFLRFVPVEAPGSSTTATRQAPRGERRERGAAAPGMG